MSTLIIDFPDCSRLGSREARPASEQQHDTITVFTDGCPAVQEGPPPLIPWWAWVLQVVILGAFIIAVAIVRFRAHDNKVDRRRLELDAQVELAKHHKICPTCLGRYEPVVK